MNTFFIISFTAPNKLEVWNGEKFAHMTATTPQKIDSAIRAIHKARQLADKIRGEQHGKISVDKVFVTIDNEEIREQIYMEVV